MRRLGSFGGGRDMAVDLGTANTLVLTEAGKGHQHQSAWVALIKNA